MLMYKIPNVVDKAPINKENPLAQSVLKSNGLERLLDFDLMLTNVLDEGAWLVIPRLGVEPSVAAPKFDPENQAWSDFGRFSIGHWTQDVAGRRLPRPADFEKKDVYNSYRVVLGDGNEWRVPVVPVDLPKVYHLNGTGEARLIVKREYMGVIPLAEKYWNMRIIREPLTVELAELKDKMDLLDVEGRQAEEKGDVNQLRKIRESREKYMKDVEGLTQKMEGAVPDDLEQAKDAIQVLKLNYNLWEEEISHLELLDVRAVLTIIDCCFLDERAIKAQEEAEKKGLTLSGTCKA